MNEYLSLTVFPDVSFNRYKLSLVVTQAPCGLTCVWVRQSLYLLHTEQYRPYLEFLRHSHLVTRRYVQTPQLVLIDTRMGTMISAITYLSTLNHRVGPELSGVVDLAINSRLNSCINRHAVMVTTAVRIVPTMSRGSACDHCCKQGSD